MSWFTLLCLSCFPIFLSFPSWFYFIFPSLSVFNHHVIAVTWFSCHLLPYCVAVVACFSAVSASHLRSITRSLPPCLYMGSKSHTSVLNASHFECTSAPSAHSEVRKKNCRVLLLVRSKKRYKNRVLWDNGCFTQSIKCRTGDAADARSQTSKRMKLGAGKNNVSIC